jgi:hypothetical protein
LSHDAFSDLPGEGRADDRVVQFFLRERQEYFVFLKLRSQVLDALHRQVVSRARGFVPSFGLIKTFPRQQPLVQKRLSPAVLLFGIVEVGRRLLDLGGLTHILQVPFLVAESEPSPDLLQGGALLVQSQRQLDRRHFHQRLPGAHAVAYIRENLFNLAFHL